MEIYLILKRDRLNELEKQEKKKKRQKEGIQSNVQVHIYEHE